MSTLVLRGKIADLKKKRDDIGVKVRALNRSILGLCQLGLTREPEDMDADSIASLAEGLAEERREYRETLDLIKEIEREL